MPLFKIPFESMLLTPERSVPSSPTLSAAVVTHTNATTNHLHTNDPSAAVDFVELTRLLQTVASRSKQKSISASSTRSSSTSSLSNTSVRKSSCLNPNTPPQFIFKKPLYNQHYHQTHFHHGLLTPIQSNTTSSFHDLKRFFVSSQHDSQQNISSRYGQWGKY